MKVTLATFKNSSISRKIVALASGLLVGLGLPPWGWWPLTIVGIAIFFAVCNLTQNDRENFTLGTLFSIAWLSLGMMWMWWLTAPGYIVAVVLFSVLHGLAAITANKL